MGVSGDSHTYEPVPSDARLVSGADVVFTNGLGLERWPDALVASTATHAEVVTVGEAGAAGEGDAVDPHRWMDPTLATSYVAAIRDGLAAADPRGATATGAGPRPTPHSSKTSTPGSVDVSWRCRRTAGSW